MPLDEYRNANRINWDERAGIHYASRAYDVAGFIANRQKISGVVEFDRHEVGDVTGKSLLHLQCHIGIDTLSWARLGAEVTGVDLSERSIESARRLSSESGTPGRFEVAELYDSPNVIDETFDIVYTGVGALTWLPDIEGWASVVSSFLRPGGTFYIRDFHPMATALDAADENAPLIVGYPYFSIDKPLKFDDENTYTDGPALTNRTAYEWPHGLGEIVTALIDAGLRIGFLHEHRFSEFQMYPSLHKGDDGKWWLPESHVEVPLMFSIKATK